MSAAREAQPALKQVERAGAEPSARDHEPGSTELAPPMGLLGASPPPGVGRPLDKGLLRMQRQLGNGRVARLIAQRAPQAPVASAAPQAEAAPTVAAGSPQAQALADQIRQQFPQGVFVALSIPEAFASREEADRSPRESISSYAWRASWAAVLRDSASSIQDLWRAHRPEGSPLPEDLGTATERQRNAAGDLLWGSAQGVVKDWLWANRQADLTRIEYVNNREIPSQAAQFAQAHSALALGGPTGLTVGRHMTYNTPDEIAQHVNGVHQAVLSLLQANPGAAGGPEPEQAARVRFLALFAHGGRRWMGGHHAAESADFTTRRVHGIVAGMSDALAPDVRLRLFACSTASSGEGGMADTFRDELRADHGAATVMGHTIAGHVVRNPTARLLHGGAGDWRLADSITDAFVNAEAVRHGVVPADTAPSDAQRRALRAILGDEIYAFFSREAWLLDIPALSNPDADQATVTAGLQDAWRAHHPDDPAIAAQVQARGEQRGRRRRGAGTARRTIQRQDATTAAPPAAAVSPTPTYATAANITDYVTLVRALEATFPGATPEETLTRLREVYYGRPWSTSRTSQWQDVLAGAPTPGDPRSAAGSGPGSLFEALRTSQELMAGGQRVDIGHMLTGLEAFLRPSSSVEIEVTGPNPVVGMPNTEFATWGGDLGSAAGQAVVDRDLGRTVLPDRDYFTTYADADDLEGNLDAYGVHQGAAASGGVARMLRGGPALPTIHGGGTPATATLLSQVISQYYLTPTSSLGAARATRYRDLVTAIGGTISGTTISNRGMIVGPIAGRVAEFAELWYMKEYRNARSTAGALWNSGPGLNTRLRIKALVMTGFFFDWLESKL